MPFMLPVPAAHSRSITGVASELLASLEGGSALGRARSVVLVVIDGLGMTQLRAHAGHARRLSALVTKMSVGHSVFPSTTAAALTSLLTGSDPGTHGLVGYRVMNTQTGRLANQLSGWEEDGLDPETWQRSETVFQRAAAAGRRSFAVGPSEYIGSGFSRAVLRGAEYVASDVLRERFAQAVALADEHDGSVVYCYMPEIDKAGHRRGVNSDRWLAALEDVDAAFATRVPDDVGVLITADHGMVDVPRTKHVLLGAKDARWDGVAQLGGEPRLLHVYTEPGADARLIAERWQELGGKTADVLTREDAIAAGVFGVVASDVAPRIGDVLVAARGLWAFYDDTLSDKGPQHMVGQHGSITAEELMVPMLRMGSFAQL